MQFTSTTLLLLVFAATASSQEAWPSTAPVEVPANLHSGVYRPVVEAMWRASPTFRRQCERLAAKPTLTVKLVVDLSHTLDPLVRASTEMYRKNGLLVFARVLIRSPDETVELIAHEMEHVIEQIDGVSMVSHESTRGIEVGRLVAREFEQSRHHAASVSGSGNRD